MEVTEVSLPEHLILSCADLLRQQPALPGIEGGQGEGGSPQLVGPRREDELVPSRLALTGPRLVKLKGLGKPLAHHEGQKRLGLSLFING